MPDFLDRYGEQLRRARRLRRRRRVRRAAALVPLAAAAIAVFALPAAPDEERPASEPPAVGTWTPRVGRPNVGLGAAIDRSPVSSEASDVLAVLRRPQTARDRELAAPRLAHAGGPVDGVQVDGVRALSEHYALVPVSDLEGEPALCVMGGGGAACGPVSSVRERGVSSLSGGPNGTVWVGVVPDGVARVRFTPEGGRPKDSVVRENFYEIRVPEPGPAQGTLEWFDADGKLIKRARE